jgi:hypothetical protein
LNEIVRPWEFEFAIAAGSGQLQTSFPRSIISTLGVVEDRFLWEHPMMGYLRNVRARIPTGGGWTFATMRLVIARLPHNTAEGSAVVKDPFTIGNEHFLYDSGSVAPPTPSDTVPWANQAFDDLRQGFRKEIIAGLLWTTSAGAGSSTCKVMAELVLQPTY